MRIRVLDVNAEERVREAFRIAGDRIEKVITRWIERLAYQGEAEIKMAADERIYQRPVRYKRYHHLFNSIAGRWERKADRIVARFGVGVQYAIIVEFRRGEIGRTRFDRSMIPAEMDIRREPESARPFSYIQLGLNRLYGEMWDELVRVAREEGV